MRLKELIIYILLGGSLAFGQVYNPRVGTPAVTDANQITAGTLSDDRLSTVPSTFGKTLWDVSGAVAAKTILNLDHVIDIRDNGAVSGADLTASIQASVNLAGVGDVVYISVSGILSEPVDINKPNITLYSDGVLLTVDPLFDTSGGDWILINVGPDGDDVVIDGLNINCLYTGSLSGLTVISAIHYETGSTKGVVKNTTLTDHPNPGSGAIFFRSGSTGHIAVQCKIIGTDWTDGAGGGIVANGIGGSILNCYAENLKDAAFSLDGTTGGIMSGNRVVNNHLDGAYLMAVGAHFHAFGVKNSIITNNLVIGCNGIGIYLYSNDPATYHMTGNIVSNNTVYTGDYAVNASSAVGIKLDDSVDGAVVSGNTYISELTGATPSWGLDVTTRNHVIMNNVVSAPSAGAGIFVRLSDPGYNGTLQIVGNSLDASARGVRFSSGDNEDYAVVVRDNVIRSASYGVDRAIGRPSGLRILLTGNQYDDVAIPQYGTRLGSYFSAKSCDLYPYDIKSQARVIGNAIPTSGTSAGDTWVQGDKIDDVSPNVYSAAGWVCVTPGTFSAATDATGDTDGATGVITGMASTADFYAGQYVTVSGGFVSTPIQILTVDSATQITVDVASTSAVSNVTVLTPDPEFVACPVLGGSWVSATVPSSATDTGVAGQVAYDSTYQYTCTATNTWKRVLIETW